MNKYINLSIALIVFSLTVNAQTWVISGPTNVCSGDQDVTYSVQSTTGGFPPMGKYTWKLNGTTVGLSFGPSADLDIPTTGSSYFLEVISSGLYATQTLTNLTGDPGTISLTSGSCNAGSVSIDASGYSGNVKWQRRVGSGSWNDYGFGFSEPLNESTLNVGTQYQYRIRTNSSCATQYSNTITFTLKNPTNAGTVSGSHSICYGSQPSQNLTGSTPSGGAGSYSYSWSKRVGSGSWQSIGGGSTLTPSEIGTLTQTTEFKRKVTDTECGADWSNNTVTITVDPLADAGTVNIVANGWCGDGNDLTMTASANVGYIDRWQYRYKNGSGSYNSWTLLTHANNTTLLGLDVDEWSGGDRTYQVRTTVRSGECVDYAYDEIVVHPRPSLASGSDIDRCGPGPVTLNANPGTHGNTVRWYSSSSGGTPFHTGTTYNISNLSSTTTFYVRSYNTSTNCEDDQMKAITATITPLVGQVSTPSGQATVCQGSTQNYSASASNATSYTWSLSPTNAGTINATTGQVNWSNEFSGNATVTVVAHGCNSTTTASKTVNVLALIGQVTVPSGPSELCQGTSGTYSASATDATSYSWSIDPSNAGSINSFGQLSLNSSFSGPLTISVVANGNCNTSSTADKQITIKPNENAIITYQYRVPTTNVNDPYSFEVSEQSISSQIFDGLGRPVQQVSLNASPQQEDLVTPVEYDEFGRQAKNHLPYIDSEKSSIYKPNALNPGGSYNSSDHYDYYKNESIHNTESAFSETRFERSPLNRPLEQGAPGDAWQLGQNTVKLQYNIANSEEAIKWVFETLLTDPIDHYGQGQLFKNTTTDEDGNSTIEYSNKQGQTILKKSQVDGSTWAETYYIYDIYGQLAVVLPPEASDRLDSEFFGQSVQNRIDFLNTWAFLYDYDGRNRMTMKKVPGADSVLMVFDKWDRLVLTQDGNQRQNNEWLFTKYDALNRPIMTGIMNGGSESVERSAVAASMQRYDTLDVNGTHQYSNHSYPTNGIAEFLTLTYYDNYNFDDHATWNSLGLGFNDHESHLSQNNAVKGQVTGTMTKAGDGSWIYSISYYDDKYRVIQTRSTNHLGGTDAVTNYYDFIGQVNRSVSTHSDVSTTTKITRSYVYDHTGRLLQTWHKLNNETDSTLIAENHYNELGELIEKDLHGGTGGVFAQSLDYTYNIRGWLTSMNNSNLSDGEGDLFGMELHYNTQDGSLNNTQLYNGNISAMKWSDLDGTGAGISERAYSFGYDKLNRLTTANHFENSGATGKHSVSGLNYDLNGNILDLKRNEKSPSTFMDDLDYNYSGNQLQYVNDLSGDTLGFNNGGTATNIDYTYDANGNMTKDRNKGIDSIYYNHLNLPIKVEFETSGDSITYLYDAAGIKLNQVVYKAGDTLKVTDYVGEFIYETDTSGVRKLQLIQHEEGRIVPLEGDTGGDWDYQYHLKDHLGNVRVTFSTTPENYTMIENFETGEENGWQDLHRHTSTDANTTPGGDEVELLQSGQTGAMIFLSVNKRDTINLSVQANYESAPSGNNFLGTAYNTLFTSFDNVYGSGVPEGGGVSSSSTVFDDALNGGAMAGKDDSNTAPRAFLNYILFDKDMNYVNAGFTQITTSAQGVGVHDSVTLDIPPFEQDGYVLAYLSNENQEAVNVHFDDFTVYHGKTNVVSTQDYYPFGLTFNESVRTASVGQNFLLTGNEKLEDWGIGVYDFNARTYDASIGRFLNIDPMADERLWATPYNFVQNNPLLKIDPKGLTDYKYDKKSGEVTQVGEANDDPDRILKTNRKGEVKTKKKTGEAKVALGGIAKGILKDGQNFKTDDIIVDVNGEGQPTTSDVESFLTQFSESIIGKEMSGAYLSKDGESDVSKIYIDETADGENTTTKSVTNLSRFGSELKPNGYKLVTHFHTHPSNTNISNYTEPYTTDYNYRDGRKHIYKNFIILTRTKTNPPEVKKRDYTKDN